jgi:signal transduction histidine kinase
MSNPFTEAERLAALREYEILDTQAEPAFDALVTLASAICKTPMSLVSLVDEGRQWFKARSGLEPSETPRSMSICSDVMLEAGVTVIPDIEQDDRFNTNPLVTGHPNLRFYAGAALLTPEGMPLGMLCVLDDKPREGLTPLQLHALRTLADQVMTQLELRKLLRKQREIGAELEKTVEQRTLALELNESALRQSQKMEALGQLTGGIAHDFNNLLQGIVGSIGVAGKLADLGRPQEITKYLDMAMTSTRRAAALTHRLLAFSRRQPLDPKPVELNELLSTSEDMLRRTLGETVKLEMVFAGGLWVARCDHNQLENAVLNLAINARDAMPAGGNLTIETGNAHLDDAYAQDYPDVSAGQYVCVSVSDTGVGMSQDVLERAFEPFFTTKPIGQGTGLGLSMIYGFLRQSDGHARIYSEVAKGTTVKLYLPRYRGEVTRLDPESPPPTLEASGARRVLVVEDDAVVRTLVTEYLGTLGYTVLVAADGDAALKQLRESKAIDLLVTDVGLPGLNGRQVADAAREVIPNLKILFMTGYAENATFHGGFLDYGMQMITKPFALDALGARVKRMLESSDYR